MRGVGFSELRSCLWEKVEAALDSQAELREAQARACEGVQVERRLAGRLPAKVVERGEQASCCLRRSEEERAEERRMLTPKRARGRGKGEGYVVDLVRLDALIRP